MNRLRPNKWMLLSVPLGLLLLLSNQACYILLGPNFYVVAEGRCYRSGQPTAINLAHWKNHYGIRTIVNLRGCNTTKHWYQVERKTARDLGIHVIDVNGFSGHYPVQPKVFRDLVDALEEAKSPVLIHCAGGAERTGLASAIYLMLDETDPDAAREQLSTYYGYFPLGGNKNMIRTLNSYAQWLEDEETAHNAQQFRHWINHVYEAQFADNS